MVCWYNTNGDIERPDLMTQLGMTLIEIMLACALGAFLLLVLVRIYVTAQQNFTVHSAIVNLQDSGRFATHFLTQYLRMAGYAGCQSTQPFVNQALALQGYQAHPPDFYGNKLRGGTDSFVVGLCAPSDDAQRFNQYAFFVGATSRKNALGQTVYALYTEAIDGDKEELVPDVTGMRLNYGVAATLNGDIAYYTDAEHVADWGSVRAVEIALLLSSEQPFYTQPVAYDFAGKAMPPDRYAHREWDIYVALRELR